MYSHSKAVGEISIVFYIFVVFIAQILMMKLLVALFLNNFINYIKTEIIEEEHDNILQILRLGFKRKLLTFANYINNNRNPSQQDTIKQSESRFGLFKMALVKKILHFSSNFNVKTKIVKYFNKLLKKRTRKIMRILIENT